MRIGINCGHTKSGTVGAGAVGFLNESNEVREVGYRLMEYLKQAGVEVFDCTNDIASSTTSNLQNICILANAQTLDAFISLHFNAGRGKGVEVYTYNGLDAAYADKMYKAMTSLGFKGRGIKNGSNLYVIRNTNAPASLLEICFVDTKEDADLYRSIGADKVAKALAEAIVGKEINPIIENELESVNDIVWELHNREIITDKELWLDKLEQDEDSYWLARKCANYIRGI